MKLTINQKRTYEAIKKATTETNSKFFTIRDIMRFANYRSPHTALKGIKELQKLKLILYQKNVVRSVGLITFVIVRSYYNGIQFNDYFSSSKEAEEFINQSNLDRENLEIIYE